MRRTLIFTLSIIILSFFFWGCGELKNKIIRSRENQKPVVFLVDIPSEDLEFSTNPRIYWYGTDPDGYITKYQYVVIPESIKDSLGIIHDLNLVKKGEDGSIASFVLALEAIPADEWIDTLISKRLKSASFAIPPESMMVVETTVTEVNTRMFASLDTQAFVVQYIFIRGVDNENAVSKIWKPKDRWGNTYRRFSRNNHPPKIHIDKKKFNSRIVHYCLPETTQTWKGIKIFWEGSDSSDYFTIQPDFLYKWELLGPFKDTLFNPLTVDTPLVDFSYDTLRETKWVSEKSKAFVDLKNYDQKPVGGGKTGWYLFRANSKDDALTEGKTPATVFFRVVNPYFSYNDQKRILLIDASYYIQTTPTPLNVEWVRNFYKDILRELKDELGYTFDFWVDSSSLPREKHLPPNEDLLSLYDLVIVIHYAKLEGLSSTYARRPQGGMAPPDTGFLQYRRYLDIGGKVWFIGANDFGIWIGEEARLHSTSPADLNTSGFYGRPLPALLARNYFGIYGIYFPKWTSGSPNEEFIGANPYVPALSFPELKVDSSTTANLIWAGFPREHFEKAVPNVNYEVIGPKTERLYTFISYKGDASSLHGKPCASRFKGPTFKTAEFCFPMFLMDQEKVKEVFGLMLGWFLKDDVT